MARDPTVQAELLAPIRRRTPQKELAAACGVSQGTISEWLGGQKAPDEAHIALLWLATGADWQRLAEAAGRDPQRVELVIRSLQATRPDDLIAHIEAELAEVPAQRQFVPDVKGAFDRAGTIVRLVERVRGGLLAPVLRDELLALMVRAVFEQAVALREMRRMGELPAESSTYARKMEYNAHLSSRVEELVGLSDLVRGHAYHVSRQYAESVRLLNQALLEGIDVEQQILALSRVAIGRAYGSGDDLHTKRQVVRRLHEKLHHLVDQGTLSTSTTLCAAEVGFARAWGAISPEDGLAILSQAEEIFQTLPATEQGGPLIRLQVAGALVEIMMRRGALSGDERDTLIRINHEALALAEEHHYDRFADQARVNLTRLMV